MSKLIITLYVLATTAGLVLIKLGSKNEAIISLLNNKVHLSLNLFNILGVVLYLTSFILYMFLISKYDLGYIIPLTTAIVYALIFITSFILFNEVFTLAKIAGIIFIMAGVVLINISKTN